MSKLDELIHQLCPTGVEYKALREIGTMIRGNGLQKKDFTEFGVGCIHYGQIYTYYGAYTYKTKSFVTPELAKKLQKVNPGDLIIAVTSENIEDVCKCVAWLGDEEIVAGGHSAIFKHNQDAKYLSYCFQTEAFFAQKRKIANGTKVIEVHPRKLDQVVIPVPPLPVQHEVVRILDNFAECTAKLTAKLISELTARKKQYEYYRRELLNFGDEVQWLPLGDVCTLKAGKTISATEISSVQSNEKPYPCFGGNGLRGYVSIYNQNGNYPLIGRQGALCGNVCYAVGEFYATEHAVAVSNDGRYNTRFLYHLLVSADLNQYKTAGAQPGLSVGKLEKVSMPVPPLEEQERIAAILDRFGTLCNDITSGLPTEIEARQRQYEYYRDKLLTFREVTTA